MKYAVCQLRDAFGCSLVNKTINTECKKFFYTQNSCHETKSRIL